jgi:hypothetical protein
MMDSSAIYTHDLMAQTMDTWAGAGYAASWPTEGTSGESTVTEAEWMTATEVPVLLQFLGKRGGVRKRRLFACACVRRIWHLLDDPRSRRAVEVAEDFADGIVDKDAAKRMRREAGRVPRVFPNAMWSPSDAAEICLNLTTEDISTAARAAFAASKAGLPLSSEREAQAALVRDIFRNPFRSATLSAAVLAWNDTTVVRLAQTAYDDRHLPSGTLDNGRLAVLADALEEAGCTDAEILGHLRGPGPHVSGCWAVDICLRKS